MSCLEVIYLKINVTLGFCNNGFNPVFAVHQHHTDIFNRQNFVAFELQNKK